MSQLQSPSSVPTTPASECCESVDANAVDGEDFPLSAVPIGRECILSPINSQLISTEIKRRLAELGLRPGVRLSVTQKTSGGGRVIRIHNTRYALDRRTASSIKVHPVTHGE